MGILSDRQIRTEVGIEPFKDYGPKEPGTISSGLTSYGYDVRLGYKFKLFSPIGAKEIDPKNFDPKCLVDVDLTPLPHTWKKNEDTGWAWRCRGCAFVPPNPHSAVVEYPHREAACSGRKDQKSDHLLIPPHSFVLAESLERFKIPRDVLCVVVGKSTYARCGLIVNVTPGEPEWEGHWTIELSNTTPLPVRVYPGEGIMQAMFFRSDERLTAVANIVWHSVSYVATGFESPSREYSERLKKASCERSYADKKGKYQDQKGLTLPKAEQAAPESPPSGDIGRLE